MMNCWMDECVGGWMDMWVDGGWVGGWMGPKGCIF